MTGNPLRIGVLSDTHGHLSPRVIARLAGCQRILHAGDVGDEEILTRLGEIAPVTAVRGNIDVGGPLAALPDTAAGHLGDLPFRMVHREEDVRDDWKRAARLIVYGHSHRPEINWHGTCLLLNPGCCGRRRFHLPLTLAILTVVGDRFVPELLSVE